MIADENNSKLLRFEDFLKFCHDYRLLLRMEEAQEIFSFLDTNNTGAIDYEEFARIITGEMKPVRKEAVLRVFNKFNKNKNGLIELDDIRANFNECRHPDVLKKIKSEEEVLAEFLDNLEYQFALLNDGSKDGFITKEEFIEFYNYISLGIEDDEYFVNMIYNTFDLKNNKNYY